MYQKPVVERFGSFRDLTLSGGTVWGSDGFSMFSAGSTTPPPSTPGGSVSISRS
ncbi:MAG: lasso RiPP family leader peptide-containing protein [Gemmatimonadetes bacterium]|nr:lasso RiPP family leader peptide-containing protein [Gemmatimonadota bacterium]